MVVGGTVVTGTVVAGTVVGGNVVGASVVGAAVEAGAVVPSALPEAESGVALLSSPQPVNRVHTAKNTAATDRIILFLIFPLLFL